MRQASPCQNPPWSRKHNTKHKLSKLEIGDKRFTCYIQSRNLNFVTSAGAMNRFAPTKVTKFKLRDCREGQIGPWQDTIKVYVTFIGKP